jgi:hypothetical protein
VIWVSKIEQGNGEQENKGVKRENKHTVLKNQEQEQNEQQTITANKKTITPPDEYEARMKTN